MSALSPQGPVAVGAESRRSGLRLRIGVGAGVGLVLIAAVAAIIVTVASGPGSTEWVDPDEAAQSAESTPGGPAVDGVPGAGEPANHIPHDVSHDAVFVHVLGAVTSPGLYQLTGGARVVDVIAAAGGLAKDADPGGVNLARIVGDGEQLYVPTVGEDVPLAQGSDAATAGGAGGLININRASQAELELLPRVGPALAQRIIDWRDSFGSFTSVDDLMSVTGIGEKTLAGLKDLVTT